MGFQWHLPLTYTSKLLRMIILYVNSTLPIITMPLCTYLSYLQSERLSKRLFRFTFWCFYFSLSSATVTTTLSLNIRTTILDPLLGYVRKGILHVL